MSGESLAGLWMASFYILQRELPHFIHSFYKDMNSIIRAQPSWPNLTLTTPQSLHLQISPDTSILGIRVSTWTFGGIKHSVHRSHLPSDKIREEASHKIVSPCDLLPVILKGVVTSLWFTVVRDEYVGLFSLHICKPISTPLIRSRITGLSSWLILP